MSKNMFAGLFGKEKVGCYMSVCPVFPMHVLLVLWHKKAEVFEQAI
jgi:hypothetical protein